MTIAQDGGKVVILTQRPPFPQENSLYSFQLMAESTAGPYSDRKYVGLLISTAHSEIFCQRSIEAMRAHCVLCSQNPPAQRCNFHSFLYTGSKTVRFNMESFYGGMSTRLKQCAVT